MDPEPAPENNIIIRSCLPNTSLRIEELYYNILYYNIIFDKNKLWSVLLSPKLLFILGFFTISIAFSEPVFLDEGDESSDKSSGEGTGGRDRTSTGSRDGTATSPTSAPGNTNRLSTASDTTSEIETTYIPREIEPNYIPRSAGTFIFNGDRSHNSVPRNPFLFRGTGVTDPSIPRTPNPYPFTFRSLPPSNLRIRELLQEVANQDPGRFIPRSTPAVNPFNMASDPSRLVGDLYNPVTGPSRPDGGPSRSDLANPIAESSNPVTEPSRPDDGPSRSDLTNPVSEPSRPVAKPVAGSSSSPADPSDSSATEITLTIRKRKVDSDSVDMDPSKKPKKD